MARGKHEAAKESEKTKPEKKPKRSGGAKKAVLIIAVVCVLLAAAALGGGYLAGHSDKIHPGMTLGGVSIGDMTVSDAAALRLRSRAILSLPYRPSRPGWR